MRMKHIMKPLFVLVLLLSSAVHAFAMPQSETYIWKTYTNGTPDKIGDWGEGKDNEVSYDQIDVDNTIYNSSWTSVGGIIKSCFDTGYCGTDVVYKTYSSNITHGTTWAYFYPDTSNTSNYYSVFDTTDL